jgi:hypothetical protein
MWDTTPAVDDQPIQSQPVDIIAQPQPAPEPATQTQRVFWCASGQSWDDWDLARQVELIDDGSVRDRDGHYHHWDSDGFENYLNMYDMNWNAQPLSKVTVGYFSNQSLTCADTVPVRPATLYLTDVVGELSTYHCQVRSHSFQIIFQLANNKALRADGQATYAITGNQLAITELVSGERIQYQLSSTRSGFHEASGWGENCYLQNGNPLP